MTTALARSDVGGAGEGPLLAPSPRRWRLQLGVAVFAACATYALFASPAQAEAVDLFPIDDVAGDALKGLGGLPGDVVEKGFQFIIQSLFGGKPAELTNKLLRWLVTIPDLSGGSVGELERTTTVMAAALLGAVATVSAFRYALAGMSPSGSGGFEGIQGLTRTAIAAAMIAAWPFAFDLMVRLSDAISSGLLSSDALKHSVSKVVASGIALGELSTWSGVPLFLGIAVAVCGILLLLALIAMKVLITALTIVIYIAMPLALVLWPIPEFSWVARMATRVLAALLAIPMLWTLVFAAFAALWSDTLLVKNNGEGVGLAGSLANAAIVKPMVAIALLYLVIALPKRLVTLVPLVGDGGSGIGQYQARQAAQSYLPAPFGAGGSRSGSPIGGSARAAGAGGQATASPSTAVKLGAGAGAGAIAAGPPGAAAGARAAGTGAAGAGGGAAAGSARGAAQGGGASAASTSRDRYGGPRQAMTPERAERARSAAERMQQRASEQPSSKSEVQEAYSSLPPDMQQATSRAVWEAPSPGDGQQAIARWSEHHGSEEYRGALFTIGGAPQQTWHESIPAPAGAGSGAPGPFSDLGGSSEAPTPAGVRGAARAPQSPPVRPTQRPEITRSTPPARPPRRPPS